MKTVSLLLRWLVSAAFLVAGTLKALDPAAFALAIFNYRLLPWSGCVVLAWFLPWLEIVAGAALLAKPFRRGAVLLLFLMLACFLGALASAAWRGLDIRCGCYGSASPFSVTEEMLFVVALAAALAAALGAEPVNKRGRADHARGCASS